MSTEKDFNNLGQWLPEKLEERRVTIDELSIKAKLSRTIIYQWLKDEVRPSSKSILKVIHYLSTVPVWKKKRGEWYQEVEEITLQEALSQYTERKLGRPKGSGGGPAPVRSRSRR